MKLLTEFEKDVIDLALQGYTQGDISAILKKPLQTISNANNRIHDKLEISIIQVCSDDEM